jgi:ankyrin repeat protein
MKIASVIVAFSMFLVSSWSAQAAAKDEYPIHEPTRSTTSVSYQSAEGMKLAAALTKEDKAAALRLLEENGKELANTKYQSSGCFHHDEGAVIFLTLRSPEMLELLLDHGADIESRNRNDETPLLQAAFDALPDTVALLINKGADPNAVRTIQAMRMCDWDGKTHVCKDKTEQKLTALDIARINLENYTKSQTLTEREQKMRNYKSIIKLLEPVTATKQ